MTACEEGGGRDEQVTDDGLRYVFHTDSTGDAAQIGDIISFHYVVKSSRDSVLGDTRQMGRPQEAELREGAFAGALEDGLQMMSAGDSATFFVSVDSLLAITGQPIPEFLDSGSALAYT
ncbi:MAG: FKBP-type peptidyl-prolyl cis-trans isomerase, partial [Catalinimonas sp.]